MAVDTFAVRIGGAYEQIDKRLGLLEGRMASLQRKVDGSFAPLRHDLILAIDRIEQKLDAPFRLAIGIVLVTWMTLMLAVLLRR